MYIPYVSEKVLELKIKRERARKKRIAILCAGAFGILMFISGSIIAGVQIYKRREKRRAERRAARRERLKKAAESVQQTELTAANDEKSDESENNPQAE